VKGGKTVAQKKQYKGDPDFYERKLARIMERMGTTDCKHNWDRRGIAWIEFRLKGQLYRFDHSVERTIY